MRPEIIYTAGLTSDFQYTAPSVFGIISEKIRMQNVRIPDIIAPHSLPYKIIAWAPTPAAPTTLAIVFTVKIAANGLFIFPFILSNILLELLPDFTATAAKEGVTDKIMDSRREQRNEIPNAKKK